MQRLLPAFITPALPIRAPQRRLRSSETPVCRGSGSRRAPVPVASDEEWSAERLGFTEVGVVLGAHGVYGEVKVRSVGEFGAVRLGGKGGARFLLRPGRKYPRPVGVTRGRQAPQHGVWIVRVDGPADREEAARLRGCRLFVKDRDAPPVDEGEFLVGQLVGLQVRHDGQAIGVVRAVVTRDEICAASGGGRRAEKVANDLLEIALVDVRQHRQWNAFEELNRTSPNLEEDVLEKAKCVLVPFVHQIVPVVEVEAGFIEIDPPAGLLDIAVVNKKTKPKPPRGLLVAARNA